LQELVKRVRVAEADHVVESRLADVWKAAREGIVAPPVEARRTRLLAGTDASPADELRRGDRLIRVQGVSSDHDVGRTGLLECDVGVVAELRIDARTHGAVRWHRLEVVAV